MEVLTKQAYNEVLYTIRGLDGDRPAWHIVLARYEKLIDLQHKQIEDVLVTNELGRNIRYRDTAGTEHQASGYGAKPPEVLMQWLEENYGREPLPVLYTKKRFYSCLRSVYNWQHHLAHLRDRWYSAMHDAALRFWTVVRSPSTLPSARVLSLHHIERWWSILTSLPRWSEALRSTDRVQWYPYWSRAWRLRATNTWSYWHSISAIARLQPGDISSLQADQPTLAWTFDFGTTSRTSTRSHPHQWRFLYSAAGRHACTRCVLTLISASDDETEFTVRWLHRPIQGWTTSQPNHSSR